MTGGQCLNFVQVSSWTNNQTVLGIIVFSRTENYIMLKSGGEGIVIVKKRYTAPGGDRDFLPYHPIPKVMLREGLLRIPS